jgi:hypothetical protein
VSFLIGPLDPAVRLIHIAAMVLWLGLLHFVAFIQPRITAGLGEGTRKEVLPHLAAETSSWLSWGALVTVVAGLLLYLDHVIRFELADISWAIHLGSLLGLLMIGLTHALILPGLKRLAGVKDGKVPPPARVNTRVQRVARITAAIGWLALLLMVIGSH